MRECERSSSRRCRARPTSRRSHAACAGRRRSAGPCRSNGCRWPAPCPRAASWPRRRSGRSRPGRRRAPRAPKWRRWRVLRGASLSIMHPHQPGWGTGMRCCARMATPLDGRRDGLAAAIAGSPGLRTSAPSGAPASTAERYAGTPPGCAPRLSHSSWTLRFDQPTGLIASLRQYPCAAGAEPTRARAGRRWPPRPPPPPRAAAPAARARRRRPPARPRERRAPRPAPTRRCPPPRARSGAPAPAAR